VKLRTLGDPALTSEAVDSDGSGGIRFCVSIHMKRGVPEAPDGCTFRNLGARDDAGS